jgi:dihydrofolate reductase
MEGPDITIFGSGTIVQQLAHDGLIDKYFFAVTPDVIGEGKSLFTNLNEIKLELLEIWFFNSRMVLLHYRADHKWNSHW